MAPQNIPQHITKNNDIRIRRIQPNNTRRTGDTCCDANGLLLCLDVDDEEALDVADECGMELDLDDFELLDL